MSERSRKSVVTVTIAGEEYSIRAEAAPEYTRECARHVDRTLAEILRQGSLVEVQKAGILAALSIADELFQARAETQALREHIERFANKLAGDVEASFHASDLASPR